MTAPVPMVEKVARAIRAKLEEGLGAATADWINEDDLARAALAAVAETLVPDVRVLSEELARTADARGNWSSAVNDALVRIDAALSDTDGTR